MRAKEISVDNVGWPPALKAACFLFADSEYRVGIVKLETGDLLIAFTDGLIEATNQDGEEWGVQGLLQQPPAERNAPKTPGSRQFDLQFYG